MELKVNNKTRKGNGTYFIDPRAITVKENFNARVVFDIEELAQQIETFGLRTPLRVKRYIEPSTGVERYELIDGERRYRAVMSLIEKNSTCNETQYVEVQFMDEKATSEDLLIEQIMRNQGKNFTDYEYALWYQKMCFNEDGSQKMTYAEAAQLIGKESYHGSICQLILELSPKCQEYFKEGKITAAMLRRLRRDAKAENKDISKDELNDLVETVINNAVLNNPKKKKLASKDFNFNFKTTTQIDTTDIMKGLKKLQKYINKIYVNENCRPDDNFSAMALLKEWEDSNNGVYIDELLKRHIVTTVNANNN